MDGERDSRGPNGDGHNVQVLSAVLLLAGFVLRRRLPAPPTMSCSFATSRCLGLAAAALKKTMEFQGCAAA